MSDRTSHEISQLNQYSLIEFLETIRLNPLLMFRMRIAFLTAVATLDCAPNSSKIRVAPNFSSTGIPRINSVTKYK